jgi:hypothetical protein
MHNLHVSCGAFNIVGVHMILSDRLTVLVVSTLACLIASEASAAGTVAETASDWGLLGTWRDASDCKQPVGKEEETYTYAMQSGRLFLIRSKQKDSNEIMSATVTTDGALDLIIRFDSFSETRENLMVKRSDGGMRTIVSRNTSTNKYSIADGKFTANGKEPNWLIRCP